MKIKTTASEAAFSNGLCERHNDILGSMVIKVKEDTKCRTETALCWAVHTKNSLMTTYGFSPYQLVLGRNPNFPSLFDDQINVPQLNEPNKPVIAEHLNALAASRQAFITNENSNRIKRALKARLPHNSDQHFMQGDVVYFRRENTKNWSGPATVIAQDHKQVLLKNGGSFIRIHPCKIILKERANDAINSPLHNTTINSKDYDSETNLEVINQNNNSIDPSDDSSDADSDDETQPSLETTPDDVPTVEQHDENKNVSENESEKTDTEVTTNDNTLLLTNNTNNPNQHSHEDQELSANNILDSSQYELKHTWKQVTKDNTKERILLKGGDKIRYKEDSDDDEWSYATVLGPAGTTTGVNKNRYNVQSDVKNTDNYSGYAEFSIFADRMGKLEIAAIEVERILYIEEPSMILMANEDAEYDKDLVKAAKDKEIENWKLYGVFKEIPKEEMENDQLISCRWIITTKGDGSTKARLVAKGYQETVNLESYSPTVEKTSLRIFLTLTAVFGWKGESLDVKSAFLQSHNLQRTVYLKPPKEYCESNNHVWKIFKPIYGLNDSALNWYKTISAELTTLGCCIGLDKSLFRKYDSNQKLIGMMIIHVDDFLFSGTDDFKNTVIKSLRSKYNFNQLQYIETFNYIGWSITQTSDCIAISQEQYMKSIEQIYVSTERKSQKKSYLTEAEIKLYQQLLGKINWLATQTRPDLSFDVYQMSLYQKSPTVDNLCKLNDVVKKLRSGPRSMIIPVLSQDFENWTLVCYSAASLNNVLPDKIRSGKGHLITIVQGRKCSIIAWKSNMVRRVTHNTLGSETLALQDCISHAILIRSTLSELLYNRRTANKIPIVCYIDSKRLRETLKSKAGKTVDHRLKVDIAEIRETTIKDNVRVEWIPTELMLANCLTKQQAGCHKLNSIVETGKLSEADLPQIVNGK